MARIEQIEDAVAQFGDIAYQGGGSWLCHDTGRTYTSAEISAMMKPVQAKLPAKPLSEKALAARAIAKKSGMKALKGTAAQKEWAEKIRESKISGVRHLPETDREEALEAVARLSAAKFWIENRSKSADVIIGMAVASMRAERKSDEIQQARNLFIMLEEQKLGNFGQSFNTARWSEDARKRFDELTAEMNKAWREVI